MWDRRSVLIVIGLVLLAFWGGISWEREDCRLVWPTSPDQMEQILQCENTGSAVQGNAR